MEFLGIKIRGDNPFLQNVRGELHLWGDHVVLQYDHKGGHKSLDSLYGICVFSSKNFYCIIGTVKQKSIF